jgi:hypothetical protein
MKGNRPKTEGETLPDKEIIAHERRTEIRYDFSEVTETDEITGETRTSYNYKYIKVYDLKDGQLNDSLNQARRKIITDKAQIENPIAFKGRRWEELACEMEEDQTMKDQLLNGDMYAGKVMDMPAEGEFVEKGNIYKFDGKHWGCRQPHNRTHYHPSETPALFNFIPIDLSGGGVPEWQPGIQVQAGEHYMYDGVEYNTLQSHTTQTGWEPPNVPSLFEPV